MSLLKPRHILKVAQQHPRYLIHLLRQKIALAGRKGWLRDNPVAYGKVPLPLAYELTPTLECNLRCTMCMLWGEKGWCKRENKDQHSGELKWETVQKIFTQIGKTHPSFIINGGEPLLYSHFGSLAKILGEHACFATICTNGILLDQLEGATLHNPYLVFLISLDGLKDVNDSIRGQGVYAKVIKNIRLLKERKNPPYVGVQFTILPGNVVQMYEFCAEMAKAKVDWVLLNPVWFLTEMQAHAYEETLRKEFKVTAKAHRGYSSSYLIDAEEFSRQYIRIKNARWPMQISCYFQDPPSDMRRYLSADQVPDTTKICFKQFVRMDITPAGEVTPCIRYPDLIFGNLATENLFDVWNGPSYAKFRELLSQAPLSVCNRCNARYLYDPKRRHL